MRKWIRWAILAVLLAGVAGSLIFINSLLPIVTGYAAKNLGSAVFVAGRSAGEVESLDLNFSLIRFVTNEVDTIHKRVVSRFLWGKSTAIFREGFGCTLVHDSETEALPGVSFPSGTKPAYNQDTIAWPLGNLMPAGDETSCVTRLQEIATSLLTDDSYGGHAFAILIMHHGVPLVEKYRTGFDANSRFLSWSMAKSFTNALTGIMVQDGNWDICKPTGIPQWQSDQRSRISINDLLQMQSGLQWNENYGSRSDVNLMLHRESDFAGYVCKQPAEFPAGTHWAYSSGSTNIVNHLMRKSFGNDADYYRFAPVRLFNKIGMPDAVFEVDESGTQVGSSYIYATARDYARFALLYLEDGVFNGERILPEGWVQYTATPVKDSGGAYGACFWLNRNGEFPSAPAGMFYCKGHDGQRIFILPDQDLAVVILGYSPGKSMDFNKILHEILQSVQ